MQLKSNAKEKRKINKKVKDEEMDKHLEDARGKNHLKYSNIAPIRFKKKSASEYVIESNSKQETFKTPTEAIKHAFEEFNNPLESLIMTIVFRKEIYQEATKSPLKEYLLRQKRIIGKDYSEAFFTEATMFMFDSNLNNFAFSKSGENIVLNACDEDGRTKDCMVLEGFNQLGINPLATKIAERYWEASWSRKTRY